MSVASEIVYPDSDDEPMAENTKQFRWIETIKGGLEVEFRDQEDVFVASDLFWYPVEGRPDIRLAPDGLVVFGRPKGDRGSYMQWRENNVPPQVVFEILSPSNTPSEMVGKRTFYEHYGVQEYYEYDPDRVILRGWLRQNGVLRPITQINGWTSPLLNIRFVLPGYGQELHIYHSSGQLFRTLVETNSLFEQERQQRLLAEAAQERERVARLQAEEALAAEKQRVAELLARLNQSEQGPS